MLGGEYSLSGIFVSFCAKLIILFAQFLFCMRAKKSAIAQVKVFTIVKSVVLHKKELAVLLIDDRKKCGYNQNIVIKHKTIAQERAQYVAQYGGRNEKEKRDSSIFQKVV